MPQRPSRKDERLGRLALLNEATERRQQPQAPQPNMMEQLAQMYGLQQAVASDPVKLRALEAETSSRTALLPEQLRALQIQNQDASTKSAWTDTMLRQQHEQGDLATQAAQHKQQWAQPTSEVDYMKQLLDNQLRQQSIPESLRALKLQNDDAAFKQQWAQPAMEQQYARGELEQQILGQKASGQPQPVDILEYYSRTGLPIPQNLQGLLTPPGQPVGPNPEVLQLQAQIADMKRIMDEKEKSDKTGKGKPSSVKKGFEGRNAWSLTSLNPVPLLFP